jgi:hypothetical protein
LERRGSDASVDDRERDTFVGSVAQSEPGSRARSQSHTTTSGPTVRSLIAIEGLRLRSFVNLAVGWDRSLSRPSCPIYIRSENFERAPSLALGSGSPLAPEDRYYVRQVDSACPVQRPTPLPHGPDDPYDPYGIA